MKNSGQFLIPHNSLILYRVSLFFHFTYMGFSSIVFLTMNRLKYLPIFLLLLSSCSYPKALELPSEKIRVFQSGERIIGYGVDIWWGYTLTATHVLEDCKKGWCTLSHTSIENYNIFHYAEVSYLGVSATLPKYVFARPKRGEWIYLFRSQSGRLMRHDGVITALDQSYYAYDENFSGRVYTGAIAIDILLEKGESGTPVWTSSWELLGIISASNQTTSTSYVVR